MQYGISRIKKRHFPSSELEVGTKRRLLDDLANLSLVQLSQTDSLQQSPTQNSRSGSPFESPSFDPLIYNSNLLRQEDPNKIVICDIDNFLRDNPDVSNEFIGTTEPIDDLSNISLDKLVIPMVEPSTTNDFLKTIFQKIFKRRLKINDKSKEIQIGELYYEQYISKYWALIKYVNPQKLVFDQYLKWLNSQIIRGKSEKYNDRFLMKFEYNSDDNNNQWEQYTSSYGSYYQPFSSNIFLENDHNMNLSEENDIIFNNEEHSEDIIMQE